MVMHEVRPGWTITREWEGYQIKADVTFKEIKPEEYVGIFFFSGGRRRSTSAKDEDLLRITRWFFEQNKPIASVCHGVEIPARAGCVKGRRMATVPKCKFDPRSLRRHVRQRGLRDRRQPRQRPHLPRPRQVHGPVMKLPAGRAGEARREVRR